MNSSGSWWRWRIWSKPSDFVDGNGGDDGGKLDPLVAKKIYGSNQTKLHQNQQITKKLGAIFGEEIFKIGRKSTKQG